MLDKIRQANPQYNINQLDSRFRQYGQVLHIDVQQAIVYAKRYQNKLAYDSSIKELEDLSCIQELSMLVYGGLDVMTGSVVGENTVLNGIEYHQCSETIIAVTDYILVVGKRQDLKNNEYDSSLCDIFYVPQGTVLELYATTLHYTPICVHDSFQTICLLLKGTGDDVKRNGILKKKNKWFIAHYENKEKIALGDVPGLKGKMIKINKI